MTQNYVPIIASSPCLNSAAEIFLGCHSENRKHHFSRNKCITFCKKDVIYNWSWTEHSKHAGRRMWILIIHLQSRGIIEACSIQKNKCQAGREQADRWLQNQFWVALTMITIEALLLAQLSLKMLKTSQTRKKSDSLLSSSYSKLSMFLLTFPTCIPVLTASSKTCCYALWESSKAYLWRLWRDDRWECSLCSIFYLDSSISWIFLPVKCCTVQLSWMQWSLTQRDTRTSERSFSCSTSRHILCEPTSPITLLDCQYTSIESSHSTRTLERQRQNWQ